MAKVECEERFWSDPRVAMAASLMRVGKSTVRGYLIDVWHASQQLGLLDATPNEIELWIEARTRREARIAREILTKTGFFSEENFEKTGRLRIDGNSSKCERAQARIKKAKAAIRSRWEKPGNREGNAPFPKTDGDTPSITSGIAESHDVTIPGVLPGESTQKYLEYVPSITLQEDSKTVRQTEPTGQKAQIPARVRSPVRVDPLVGFIPDAEDVEAATGLSRSIAVIAIDEGIPDGAEALSANRWASVLRGVQATGGGDVRAAHATAVWALQSAWWRPRVLADPSLLVRSLEKIRAQERGNGRQARSKRGY